MNHTVSTYVYVLLALFAVPPKSVTAPRPRPGRRNKAFFPRELWDFDL